ncbi:hypothetical protein CYY_001521 [Polysphondylium violaceum]|uniref:Acetyl-CoA synthetase-like protein n=1 Tax=Polysphondylium violaceum TaxID=133409 RepID=A0A8J4Q9A8_9MYCE|nr:hypothetical protein CYY_001521 [Polysphondylium violaceum]
MTKVTLYEIFKNTTTKNPTKTLVTIPSQQLNTNTNEFSFLNISYQKFLNDSTSFANKLQSQSFKPNDVISIVIPNSYSILSTFMATTFSKCIAAPLNSNYTKDEFNFYFKDMGSKLVIIQKGYKEAIEACIELGIKYWVLEQFEQFDQQRLYYTIKENEETIFTTETIGSNEFIKLDNEPEPNDVALFLHTSGTTSRPKGVPLTHENLATSSKNITDTLHLNEQDCSLVVMPLFHVHGLIGVCLSTFYSGGSLVVPVRFSASVFWNQIKQFKVNWYSAVPTIHTIVCSIQSSAPESTKMSNKGILRFIRSSSSSLSPTLLGTLETFFGCPVIESYGMTEASHQMASNPLPQDGTRKPGSVGRGVNVKISIVNDAGDHLEQGQAGEVCIQGKNVMHGYHNNPQANIDNFTKDGWFLTGDIGFLDAEGYLFLNGRKKEIINRGGEKISPLEVDNALLENDKVLEAVCFGVPDEKYGEEIWAAVIPKEGQELTVEELNQFLQKKLVAFKIPKKIILTTEFPKTASGKIQRRFVSEYFLKNNK